MLCQKCKQRQANTHVKQVINGELTEKMSGNLGKMERRFSIGGLKSGNTKHEDK